MPAKIRVLDDKTINQIAAGEVIESPSSIVKELIENSIDARSKRITVEIEGGGLKLIRVSDDGEGMGRDDALLAFERHATSKLKSVGDFQTLHSMGFRGEALASILAVAEVDLTTSDGEVGTHIRGGRGRIAKVETGARAQGTTFEVRDLFLSVPARLQFQKGERSLSSDITKMVSRLALSYPEVSFRLIAKGKTLFHTSDHNLKERAKALLGQPFVEGAKEIDYREGEFAIKGFVGSLGSARTNRSGQYLFINQRAIVSPVISQGVEEGCGTRLNSREYPTFLLHITLDPSTVDVNVHPQKREVRLKHPHTLKEDVRKVVASAFTVASKPMPKMTFEPVSSFSFKESPPSPPTYEPSPAATFVRPEFEILGLFKHFLFVKEGDGVTLINLKRAQGALALRKGEGVPDQQRLLLPLTLDFAPHEVEQLLEHTESLNAKGIGIRPFGKESFIVESLTPLIDEQGVRPLLEALLTQGERMKWEETLTSSRQRPYTLHEGRELYKQIKDHNLVATCAAVLTEKEIDALIKTS